MMPYHFTNLLATRVMQWPLLLLLLLLALVLFLPACNISEGGSALLCSNTRILVHSLDNGAALTPPMGFNSFMAGNDFPKGQAGLELIADFLVQPLLSSLPHSNNKSSSLRDLGYMYVNTDEGWEQPTRNQTTGKLQWNETLYPAGFPKFIQTLHERKLKFGIYSAASAVTCGSRPGQLYHEDLDVQTYVNDWDVDYIKADNCASYALDSSVRFAALRDALYRTTCKAVVLSIEPFSMTPDPAQSIQVANLWRVGCDIEANFESILNRADISDKWAPLAGPGGGWNDPDMIHLQNPPPSGRPADNNTASEKGLSLGENRIYFGLWALMKAPLLLSANLPKLHPDIIHDIISNPEVIAINQDAAGYQGRKIQVDGVPLPWLVGLEDCNAAPPGQLQRHYRQGSGKLVGDTRTWTVKLISLNNNNNNNNNRNMTTTGTTAAATAASTSSLAHANNEAYQLMNDITGRCLAVFSQRIAPVLVPCANSTTFDSSQYWIFDKGITTVTSITNVATGWALAIHNNTLYASSHGSDAVNVSDAAYGQGGLVMIPPYDQDACSGRDCQNYDPSQMWYYSTYDKFLRHALYTASINHKPPEGDGYTLTPKVPTFRHHCLAHVLSTRNAGSKSGTLEVWGGPLSSGDYVLGLVNRGHAPANITASFDSLLEATHDPSLLLSQVEISTSTTRTATRYRIRDLWKHKPLGAFDESFTVYVQGHDIGLYRLSPIVVESNVSATGL